MYSRPSASQIRLPSPRSTKGGVPPTARNARTGELTPPGMILCERSNSRSFLEVMDAKEAGEFARASLNVRRVEQSADNCDSVGSRLEQNQGVFFRDSPDRDDRAAEARFSFAVQGKRRARGAGFSAGGESAAECDIVRARGASRQR